tara:strand:- start:4732 stop:4905 length:174 start_codon:yes stop_codon:yes gene_type:complete
MKKEPTPNGFNIPKSFITSDLGFKRSAAGAVGGKRRSKNMTNEQVKSFVLRIKDAPK